MHRTTRMGLIGALLAMVAPACGPAAEVDGKVNAPLPKVTVPPPQASPPETTLTDDHDPAPYLERLADPAARRPALIRLTALHEDALARDGRHRDGPTVKPFVNRIVGPLTEVCIASNVDPQVRSSVVQLLSDLRDPRAEPCILQTLDGYVVDGTEDDVRAAVRAVKDLKLRSASAPLMSVFAKIQASRPKGATIYRDVADAMEAILDPRWEPQLIAYLSRPFDPSVPASLTNEAFWQIVSAKLLGLMKSQDAVRPLLKVVLSPYKAPAAMTAILALMKIGKPVIAPTIALLEGKDPELVTYSRAECTNAAAGDPEGQKAAATAHVGVAALVLATLGRAEVAAPLLQAMAGADDVTRAIIARELTKVPKTAATVKAFQQAFEKTPVSLSLPGAGRSAREVLLESAVSFYDPTFVPWIVKQAHVMKAPEEDLGAIREASLISAMKIATADQADLLDKLAAMKVTHGSTTAPAGRDFVKELRIAKEVAATCGREVACYLTRLADPTSQQEATQFQGVKSATMIGVLGDPTSRVKIVEAMPKLTNGMVRFAAISVVDFLSPRGDLSLASTLRAIVEAGEASRDQSQIRLNSPFRTVIYRLEARSQ